MNLTPEMMDALRFMRHLADFDNSQDEQIKQMSPEKIVRQMCEFEFNDADIAKQVAHWMILTGAKPENF